MPIGTFAFNYVLILYWSIRFLELLLSFIKSFYIWGLVELFNFYWFIWLWTYDPLHWHWCLCTIKSSLYFPSTIFCLLMRILFLINPLWRRLFKLKKKKLLFLMLLMNFDYILCNCNEWITLWTKGAIFLRRILNVFLAELWYV